MNDPCEVEGTGAAERQRKVRTTWSADTCAVKGRGSWVASVSEMGAEG